MSSVVVKQLPSVPTKQIISSNSPPECGCVKVEPLNGYESAIYTINMKNNKTNFVYSIKCPQNVNINNHVVKIEDKRVEVYVHNDSNQTIELEISYYAF